MCAFIVADVPSYALPPGLAWQQSGDKFNKICKPSPAVILRKVVFPLNSSQFSRFTLILSRYYTQHEIETVCSNPVRILIPHAIKFSTPTAILSLLSNIPAFLRTSASQIPWVSSPGCGGRGWGEQVNTSV